MNLKDFIRSIPDYPKKGILFRDITTLIKDEKAFAATIDQIIERSKNFKIDKIAAIESRGFVFASDLKSISTFPKFNNSINRNALALFLKHSSIPAPYSIYEDIFKSYTKISLFYKGSFRLKLTKPQLKKLEGMGYLVERRQES